MSDVDPRDLAALVLQYCLAFSFVASLAWKLRFPTRFVSIVRSYQMLPHALVPFLVSVVLIVECIVVVALLLDVLVGVAAAMALGLMATIAVVFSTILAMGWEVECGCSFADEGHVVSWTTVLRALTLGGIAAAALVYAYSMDGTNFHHVSFGFRVEAGAIALCCCTLGAWVRPLVHILTSWRYTQST